MDKKEELEIDFLKKEEKDYIVKFLEELSKVFDFENEDNDYMSQKEELLHKCLWLEGDNYTFLDLRRDLSSFEEDDKTSKNTLIDNRSYIGEDKMTEVYQCLTEKLL